jgi:hypothetical protein
MVVARRRRERICAGWPGPGGQQSRDRLDGTLRHQAGRQPGRSPGRALEPDRVPRPGADRPLTCRIDGCAAGKCFTARWSWLGSGAAERRRSIPDAAQDVRHVPRWRQASGPGLAAAASDPAAAASRPRCPADAHAFDPLSCRSWWGRNCLWAQRPEWSRQERPTPPDWRTRYPQWVRWPQGEWERGGQLWCERKPGRDRESIRARVRELQWQRPCPASVRSDWRQVRRSRPLR